MTSVSSSSTPKSTYRRATISGIAGLVVFGCALAFGAGQAPPQPQPQSQSSAGNQVAGAAPVSAAAVRSAPSAPRPQAAPTNPDQALIAFSRPNFTTDASHIWTKLPNDPQATDLSLVELPPGDVVDLDPAWSTDGSRIALSRGPIVPDVPAIAADRKTTPEPTPKAAAKPAPKAAPAPVRRDIWVMDFDGTGLVNLTGSLRSDPAIGTNGFYSPTWSPDGVRLAAALGSANIVIFNVTDPADYRIVPRPTGVVSVREPAWSPAGTRIAFQGDFTSGGAYSDIWVMDGDGGNPDQLTSDDPDGGTFGDSDPAWSPDSTTIAFSRWTSGGGPVPIVVIDADGSDPRQLDTGIDLSQFEPVWSPDGQQIVTSVWEPGEVYTDSQYDLWAFGSANGANARRITATADYEFSPAWQPALPTTDLHLNKTTSLGGEGGVDATAKPYRATKPRTAQRAAEVEEAVPGQEFSYYLDVFNSGASQTYDLVVTDQLPAQVELVSASPQCTGTTTVTCRLEAFPPGYGLIFELRVRVKPDASGDAVNTATASSQNPDPDPGDNTSTATVRIVSDADVQIYKGTNLGGDGCDGECPGLTSHRARVAAQEADEVVTGDEFTYFLDVFNAGPATARGLTVTDTLPAEIEIVSIEEGCERDGQTVTCSRSSLNADTWWYIDIDVRVVGRCGDIVNTATVVSGSPDPDKDNNSATNTVHISCADLAIEKTDNADPVLLGDQLTYTLTITNNGTDTATDVQLTDTLPADVDIVSVTPSDPCTTTGQRISCALGDIPSGETRTVTIVVLPQNPGELQNTATVGSETADPDETNNTDTETTLVRGTDMTVTVTDDPDPVPFGELLTYTITVTNSGPQAAQAEVVNTLPSGVRIESVPAGCTINGRVIRCDTVTVEPEASTTLVITVRPFVVADIVNRTQVLIDLPDTNPENNRVDTTTTVRGSGLAIAATATPEPVDGNQPLTYDITVNNSGPATTTDTSVVVSWNNPPPAATIDSSIPCTIASRRMLCQLGTMPAGDSRTFTITVLPNRAGELTTTLVAQSTVPDEDPEDNQVVLTSTVRPADLVLTQVVTPRPGFVGGTLTYTLRITNTGTALARDVTLIHRRPAGPQVGTVTPSTGTCVAAPVLRCELGDLAPGADPITVVVKLRPVAEGGLITSALATTSTTEPDLTDNEVRASTEVLQPKLVLPKVGSPGFTALAVGTDFPANTDIALRWVEGLNPAIGSTTVRTDANGGFRFRMLVLPRDRLGVREAEATGPVDSFEAVLAEHLVVPNPVAPKRFISRR